MWSTNGSGGRMSEGFDHYKNTYSEEVAHSIGFIHQSHDFFTRSKALHLLRLVRRHLGKTSLLSILDVGCGTGVTDALIASKFRSVHGVDIAAGVIEKARETNPGVDYRAYDGSTLPFDENSVDVSFAICVLHHVEPPARQRFVSEMQRVTRPGGLIVIFEHNPLNPLTRLAVARCEFDEDVVLLNRPEVQGLVEGAHVDLVESRYILFLPWLMSLSQGLDRAFGRIPLGAQHIVVGQKRP